LDTYTLSWPTEKKKYMWFMTVSGESDQEQQRLIRSLDCSYFLMRDGLKYPAESIEMKE